MEEWFRIILRTQLCIIRVYGSRNNIHKNESAKVCWGEAKSFQKCHQTGGDSCKCLHPPTKNSLTQRFICFICDLTNQTNVTLVLMEAKRTSHSMVLFFRVELEEISYQSVKETVWYMFCSPVKRHERIAFPKKENVYHRYLK